MKNQRIKKSIASSKEIRTRKTTRKIAMMENSIGSTTTAIAVSDQVKLFKTRSLEKYSEKESMRGEKDAKVNTKGNRKTSARKNRIRYQPESLANTCLKVIAEHFSGPMMSHVRANQVPVLSSLLDIDLDIETASAYIYDENYWRRRAMSKNWKTFEISNHGLTYKQMFMEKELSELLENFSPQDDFVIPKKKSYSFDESKDNHEEPVSEEMILKHLKAAQDYVFQLKITQLLSHIDMKVIFDHLPNLSRLELSFGVMKVGMGYERSLFGMKLSDATSLACAMKKSSTLTSLSLPSNLIDDDLLRMLTTGLISNSTVTELDLSHNKISNHGARLLAKLLHPKSVLTNLNLCDNQLHAEAGRYFGRALKRNNSLLSMNLRLNRLTDMGGKFLIEGLQTNRSLSNLNLSCNSLSTKSVDALCHVLEPKLESSLSSLDLSCNEINEDDGEKLVHVLRKGCNLVSIDLRKNHLGESQDAILEIVKRSELVIRREHD